MTDANTVTLDRGLEELTERRSREAQADLLNKNIRAAAAAEASLYGVDVDVWLELPPDSRRKLMAKGKPQADRTEDESTFVRMDASGDVAALDTKFSRLERSLIKRDEVKDWVLVCDPVKHDRRWGDYTPGVSKMLREVAKKKTDPAFYNPPFTVEPVAPFPPDPTVVCDMHGSDGRICDFATYEEEGSKEDNTLLLYHQQKVHPDELKARELRDRNAESRADREQNKTLLGVIASLQERLAKVEGKDA